jgi:hypothetical protein
MRKLVLLIIISFWGCEDNLELLDIPIDSTVGVNNQNTTTNLPYDPIVWFPFNGNTDDESGNELHGILYEGNYTSCRNNNEISSLKLDIDDTPNWGEENDRVEVPYNPIMDTDKLTISAWVNLNEKEGVYSSRNYSIVSRWSLVYEGTEEEKASYSFYINPDLNIEFAYSNNTKNVTNQFKSEEVIEYGEWNHVAITIDNINIRLYLNGSLIKEDDVIEGTLLPKSNIDMFLGERKQYNGYWYHLDGKLDDIGVWGRALTPCEINDLYTM